MQLTMFKAMQTPSIITQRNEATIPKLRNMMAAVSCSRNNGKKHTGENTSVIKNSVIILICSDSYYIVSPTQDLNISSVFSLWHITDYLCQHWVSRSIKV